MQISGIGGLGVNAASGLSQAAGLPTNPGAEVGTGFQQMLAGLTSASGDADAAIVDLATGGERDLHDVVLAVELESLAFDLAVQIRNRLLEAYSEVFRMQV
ncbi:MAG: flagellar hook-basal body complex protein FliE [Dehalococcoidia bacterium]